MRLNRVDKNGLYVDLPSLACQAAIELVVIRNGAGSLTESIDELASVLGEQRPEDGRLAHFSDPTPSHTIYQALGDAGLDDPPVATYSELESRIIGVAGRLAKVASETAAGGKDDAEIDALHRFCRALSGRSLAAERF